MKIQPQNPQPSVFTPLTITLETPEEVGRMYAVFNFTPILAALNWIPECAKDEAYYKLEAANSAAGNEPIKFYDWHVALCAAFDNKKKQQ